MCVNNRMTVVIPNYLREILILCEEYEREYHELEEMIKDHSQLSKDSIFPKLTTLVLHASNIKKLILQPNKKRKEEQWGTDFRNIRIQSIEQYYDVTRLIEIRNTKLRNSLEHYDERMDTFFSKLVSNRNTLIEDLHIERIIFNTTLPTRDFHNTKTTLLLKCFIISEMTYVNDGDELNLKKVYSEVIYLMERTKIALNDPILFEPSHSITLRPENRLD